MFIFRRTTKGALLDTRTVIEKTRDFRHNELCLPSISILKEKKESNWRKYVIRNQKQTGTCVAHAVVKSIGINNYIEEGKFLDLSPRFIYAQRSNSGEGMYGPNAVDIACKAGSPLEVQLPFINNEAGMSSISDATEFDKQVALIAKPKNYVFMDTNDIDEVAKHIESTKSSVVLFFKFNNSEWKSVPKIKSGAVVNSYHAVCGTNGILYNGDTAIVIEDSWGPAFGMGGRRIITREWFNNNRCTFAAYFIDLKNNWRDSTEIVVAPKFNFTVNMCVGQSGSEVKKLQECLKFLKLFPQVQECTGYYGGITASAVLEFQRKYMEYSEDIEQLKGTHCGPKTRQELNKIFI